jgi:hypothetical protein
MLDIIDLILKLLACASLSIVTMIQFESVKKRIKFFRSTEFLHIMLIVMGFTGISAILIDGYINSESQKETTNAQVKINKALEEANEELKTQNKIREKDKADRDTMHKRDSITSKKQLIALEDSIHNSKILEAPTLDEDYNLPPSLRVVKGDILDSIIFNINIVDVTDYVAKFLDDEVVIITASANGLSIRKNEHTKLSFATCSKGLSKYSMCVVTIKTNSFHKKGYVYYQLNFSNSYGIKQSPFTKIFEFNCDNDKAIHLEEPDEKDIEIIDNYIQRNAKKLEKDS